MIDNYLCRVLYIDLTRKKFWVEFRRDLFEEFLGGVGVAAKLLDEEISGKRIDPLSPDNVIIFAIGPLTGAYPYASKTVAMFVSPLTGNLGESHAGGRSATSIRMAGYGAIVIKGASQHPIYVVVRGNKVYFKDASALWGMRSSYTVGRVIRQVEQDAGLRTIMRIGRAGERLVRYACVITETYRHFGRLGLGAVFGSKKLKAIVISGKLRIPVPHKREYREVYDQIYEYATKSDVMKKYHDLGTAMNIIPLNKLKALPTMNLKRGDFNLAERISGEYIAETCLGRRLACTHCPTACIHLAALREPYEDEPYFYKTTFISYDYELIYSLGTMLGIGNAAELLRLIDQVETYGLDAMSTGVCLAWATEALEKGIITEDDTLTKLKWGDYNGYLKGIEYIVEQPNEFYKTLAQGVYKASKKYGGEDFALAFGGNEMPGYHTGPSAYLGYLTGARHSHLDSAGYSLDQRYLSRGEKLPSAEDLVNKLIEEECWRQILASLVVCFFARGIYKPDITVKALAALGYQINEDALRKLGEKIYSIKYSLKIKLGFDPKSLTVPARVFETPSPMGRIDKEFINEALTHFKRRIADIIGKLNY